MNRTDKIGEVARREALGAAWAGSARQLRQELEAEARAEYEEHGTGVTWTVRDLGKVVLPLSTEAPFVADPAALLKWCKEHHPENVETVEQVRSAFLDWLSKNVQITDDGRVVTPDGGEEVPGMAVREGGRPKALSITVERDAKALYAHYASREVERLLELEHGRQRPAVADAS